MSATRTASTGVTFFKQLWVWMLAALVALFTIGATVGNQALADGELTAPSVSKDISDNGDGTSTLSLSVTGSSAKSEETVTSGANVIVVVDKSNSMNNHSQSSAGGWGYTSWSDSGSTKFYPLAVRVNNQYINLSTMTEAEIEAAGYGSTYTGTLYINSNASGTGNWSTYASNRARFTATTRLADTKDAVNDLAQTLYDANAGVSMSLISFSSSATTNVELQNINEGNNLTTYKNAVNGLTTSQGTNWTNALSAAYTQAFKVASSEVPTYVIFLTDGEPNGGDGGTYANQIQALTNTELFCIFAFGDSGATTLENLAKQAGATFYNASDLDALKEAFADITKTITGNLSYGKVTINDSVTTDVTSVSTNLISGSAGGFTYTVTDKDGSTVASWTQGETAYDGINEASFTNGAVQWNLGDNYTLRDGYTYTVSFVVWPNQDAFDYVADLNNGMGTASWDDSTAVPVYDDDGNLKYYKGGSSAYPSIVKYPNGTFGILTNDGQSITYSIAKEVDGVTTYSDPITVDMPTPDPVDIQSTKLELEKKWDDETDANQRPGSVTLDLYMGSDVYLGNLELSNSNNWKIADALTISPGVMVSSSSKAYSTSYPQVTYDGTDYAVLEPGHDYYFQENPQDYHFELTAYTYHPMIVDGKLYNVTFSADGTTVESATEMTNISATNTLKGRLYVTKTVDIAEGAIGVDLEKTPFEITITLKDADGKAIEGEGTGEGKNGVMYRIQYGPNNPDRGEYDSTYDNYGRSDQKTFERGTITEKIYAGDTIYVGNLPAGATYEVSEGTLPSGWALDGITYGDTAKKIGGNDEDQVTVTNKLTTTNIELIKNDAEGKVLAGATFMLYSDEACKNALFTEDKVSDSDGLIWSGPIADGTYYLKETKAPEGGYQLLEDAIKIVVSDGKATVDSDYANAKNADDSITVTISNIKLVSVGVSKKWDDSDDQDGIRPTSVEVTLLANGEAVEQEGITAKQTLNANNGWAHTWEGLNQVKDGQKIEYTVEETKTDVIKGEDGVGTYAYKVTGDAETGFTVTNTHTPEVITVEGTKTWDDEKYSSAGPTGDNDYERVSVTITLAGSDGSTYSVELDGTADDEPEGADPTGYESPAWAYIFVNLPKYANGEEIEYTVSEIAPNGWSAEVDGDDVTNTPAETKVVNDDEVGITIKKVDSATGTEVGLAGAVFTLTPAPDGSESKTYTTGSDGTVKITFDGYTSDENVDVAKTSTYTLTETSAPEGYTPSDQTYTITVKEELASITLNEGNKWEWLYNLNVGATPDFKDGVITVSDEPITTSVTVDKAWDDNNNQDGLRPTTLTYTLTGTAAGKTVYSDTQEVAVESDGSASYTWDDLATYYDGEEVTYAVTEAEVTGYTSNVSGDVEDGFTVTNTHTPDTTSVTVTKEWKDGNSDARPDNVSVTLKADGDQVGAEVTLNADNSWTYTWDGLAVNKDGEAIAYTVEEADVPGYASDVTVTGDAEKGYTATVTNSNVTVDTNTEEFFKKSVTAANNVLDATFSFTISADEGTPMPARTEGTVTYVAGDTDDKTIDFGSITYTEEGTFTYTITEADPADGWKVTGSPATVTVKVEGNAADGFTAKVKGDTITNAYAASGSVVLEATKVAEGFTLEANQFSFELKEGDSILQTKTNDADGKVVFDEIEYTAAGTYTYTINEVVVKEDGIADDTHVCNVTVTVVDKGDGNLDASAEYSGSNTFTNVHNDNEKDVTSAKDAEISVDGELVEAGDTLTYTITYANNTDGVAVVTVIDTIPSNTTYVEGSASDGGDYADGEITWTIAGVDPGATGTVTFKVTVNEGSNGQTIENAATVSDGENESSTNAVTTSVPEKDVKDSSGSSVDGGSVQVGDTLTYEVTFTLAEAATSVVVTDEVPANTTLVEDSISDGGTVSEGTITWDLGDLAAGTHTVSFKVTVDESAATVDAITNTASISVNNHSSVETNTTTTTPETGTLSVSKTVKVPEGYEIDTAKAFTFVITLTDKNGTALAGSYNYTGSVEGTLKSGDTVTLKHGESITIAGLPAGAKYSIAETAPAGYTPTPDEGTIDGTIGSGETAATAAFENNYAAEPTSVVLTAFKELDGWTLNSGQFTFVLKDSGGTELQKTTNDGDGNVAFAAIWYDKPGEYKYTITELVNGSENPGVTFDTHACDVTVTVKDNGDGTLTASVVYSDGEKALFTNTFTPAIIKGEAGVVGSKSIYGRDMFKDESFVFTLTASSTEPVDAPTSTAVAEGKVVFGSDPMTAEVSNLKDASIGADSAAASFEFGEISFYEIGTYVFDVNETVGSASGMTYDAHTGTATVNVEASEPNEKGEVALVPTVTYTDKAPMSFSNIYSATGDATISGTKELIGTDLTELVEAEKQAEEQAALESQQKRDEEIAQLMASQETEGEEAAEDTEASDGEAEQVDGDTEDQAENPEEAENADGADAEPAADDAAPADDATSGDEEAAEDAASEEANADAAEDVADDQAAAEDYVAPETVDVEAFAEVYAGNEFAFSGEVEMDGLGGIADAIVDAVSADAAYADEAEAEAEEAEEADGAVDEAAVAAEEELAARTAEINQRYDAELKAQIEELRVQLEADIEAALGVNRQLVDGEFSFDLSYTNGKDYKGQSVATAWNDADGKVEFPTLKYGVGDGEGTNLAALVNDGAATLGQTKDGKPQYTIVYTVTENPSGNTAITINTEVANVTVTVVDNGDGTLSAIVSPEAPSFTFTNTYKSLTAELPVQGSKAMEGGRPVNAGDFSFTITGSEGAPMPEQTTVYNDANQAIDFGTIVYTQDCFAGQPVEETEEIVDEETGEVIGYEVRPLPRSATYTYTVVENASSLAGVTIDPVVKTFTVTVTDDGSGLIDLATDLTPQTLVFTNSYEPAPATSSVTDQIKISKSLTGRDLAEGEFEFVMYDGGGNEVGTGTNAADGTVAMPAVTFAKSGNYGYRVVERDAGKSIDGVTYDTKEYAFTAAVTDVFETAELAVEWVGPETDVVFANVYVPTRTDGQIVAQKVVSGAELAAGQFAFNLLDAAGKVVQTKTNAADGSVTFDAIEYEQAGTYEYTIQEVNDGQPGYSYDTAARTVVVTVADDGLGTLTATVEGNGPVITNTYAPSAANDVTIAAVKELKGGALTENRFAFELKDAEGAVVSVARNAADGTVAFPSMSFSEVGTYAYTVSERNDGQQYVTYDDSVKNVTVTVADDGEGRLVATLSGDKLSFVNSYNPPSPGIVPATPTIVKTGDATAPVAPIAAAAGLALVAGGAWALRRRGRQA